MHYKYRLSQVNLGYVSIKIYRSKYHYIYSVMPQFVQRSNFHVGIHKELIIIIFVLSPGKGPGDLYYITGLLLVQTPVSHKEFLTTTLKHSSLLLLLHFVFPL